MDPLESRCTATTFEWRGGSGPNRRRADYASSRARSYLLWPQVPVRVNSPSNKCTTPPRKIALAGLEKSHSWYCRKVDSWPPALRHRRILPIALEHLHDDPVVLLEGPRSVGKSTLLRQIAEHRGGRILDLDDPATLNAVQADPATLLSGDQLVCIDEYQRAPIVLDAIKAELNRSTRPGRFVLTGSAQHRALPDSSQALTGRLDCLQVLPLSQGEIDGVRETWLAQLFHDADALLSPQRSSTTRTEYITRMATGGFPLALAASGVTARNRWVDNYVSLTLSRDVRDLSEIRHGALLPDLLQRLAGQTAQVLNMSRAAAAVGLEANAAARYLALLEQVFLLYRLQAWGATLNARSGKLPKIHVLDSAVAARLMRLTPARLEGAEPAALTEFGHLLETFVIGELRKQASWLDGIYPPGHWRTHDSAEVDFILERDDGRVIAIEVKASTRAQPRDFRALALLRDKIGSTFAAGAVLYPGAQSFRFGERLYAFPIDQLWQASGGTA